MVTAAVFRTISSWKTSLYVNAAPIFWRERGKKRKESVGRRRNKEGDEREKNRTK